MDHRPRIFADFHNADPRGCVRLNCAGTVDDLSRQQVVLRDGLGLVVYSEELEADGMAHYSTEECLWVAVVDWDAIRGTEPRCPAAEDFCPADDRAARQRTVA